MAIEMSREQIMDCLHRQLVNPFIDPWHCCGTHCTILVPDGCADCGLVGTPEQYGVYQSLLRDPAVPADKAQPLIDTLEASKRYFIEYDDCAPDDLPVLQAAYDLAVQYLEV